MVNYERVKSLISAFENYISQSGLRNKSDILRQSHLIMTGLTSTERLVLVRSINTLLNTWGMLHQTEIILMDSNELSSKTDDDIASYIAKKMSDASDGILLVEHANELCTAAMDSIVPQIEVKKDQLLFILAGDSPQMNDFLIANPGIAHRMKFVDLDNPYGFRISNMQTYQEKLSNYVGWKCFKAFVHNLEIERDYEKPYRLFTFVGNPGTGKTTAARLLGDIMFELGLIKTNKVVVCDCIDLLGSYIGETAVKTNEIIDRAIGGMLYLENMHSLIQDDQDDPLKFELEAVYTLLKRMEEERGKLIVIIAVDKENKDKVMSINPGLSRRIQHSIEFEDFTIEELRQIVFPSTAPYYISSVVNKEIMNFITLTWQNRDQDFKSASWASLFGGNIVYHALKRNDVVINDEGQVVITIDDVHKAIEEMR